MTDFTKGKFTADSITKMISRRTELVGRIECIERCKGNAIDEHYTRVEVSSNGTCAFTISKECFLMAADEQIDKATIEVKALDVKLGAIESLMNANS